MKLRNKALGLLAMGIAVTAPLSAFAAMSYGNHDGTASMKVSSWGNNYAALSGTHRSYAGKPIYTQGRAHNAVGATGWKRASTNTTSKSNRSVSFAVTNTNYTFKRINAASARLCTDVRLWPDPCGSAVTFRR